MHATKQRCLMSIEKGADALAARWTEARICDSDIHDECQQHQSENTGREPHAAPELSVLLPLFQFVVTNGQDARKQLEQRVRFPIFAFAYVGADRFSRLIGNLTVCIHMKADRRRKTFQQSAFGFVGGVWLTIDDQTQDAVFTAEHFIGLDLFIDPFRNGRLWRTNNYQVARLTECDLDLAAEVGGARQFIAIA